MELRGGQIGNGVWTTVVRTPDFIIREAFGWLRVVISYVLKTPRSMGNSLGAWKPGGVVRLSVMLRKMAVAWSRVSAAKL